MLNFLWIRLTHLEANSSGTSAGAIRNAGPIRSSNARNRKNCMAFQPPRASSDE